MDQAQFKVQLKFLSIKSIRNKQRSNERQVMTSRDDPASQMYFKFYY